MRKQLSYFTFHYPVGAIAGSIVIMEIAVSYTHLNGKDFMEKEKILKLSDAFETKSNDPMLELKVRVININPEADVYKRQQ